MLASFLKVHTFDTLWINFLHHSDIIDLKHLELLYNYLNK